MKMLLSLLFLLSVFATSGQEWLKTTPDSLLTVMTPVSLNRTDTMGVRVYSGVIDNAGFIIMKIPLSAEDRFVIVDSEEKLEEAYAGFRASYIRKNKGTILRSEIVNKGKLKVLRFSANMTVNGVPALHHGMIAIIREEVYSIVMQVVQAEDKNMEPITRRFFNSVTFSPELTLNDQMSSEFAKGYNFGYNVAQLLIPVIIIGLIIFFVLRSRNKKG